MAQALQEVADALGVRTAAGNRFEGRSCGHASFETREIASPARTGPGVATRA